MHEIVPVYKPRCRTPLESVELFKRQYPIYQHKTISYAGRLDPMAEGLLILLIGNTNKHRAQFESLPKTYNFSFIGGLTTDTYDVLGKVVSVHNFPDITDSIVRNTLTSFVGTYRQEYPPYSSKTVAGKPLFYWARTGHLDAITIPSHEVTIYSINLIESTSLKATEMIGSIVSDVSHVKGNFRQDEIIKRWHDIDSQLPPTIDVFHLTAEVTSGTYIRSLVHDIGKKLTCGALTYQIKRTQIGDYKLEDALRLNEQ